MKPYSIQLPDGFDAMRKGAGVTKPELAHTLNEYVAERRLAVRIGGVMDSSSALNGKYYPQKKWIAEFNGQGKRMITAEDFLLVGLMGSDAQIANLQADLANRWLVVGTGLNYNRTDLYATIIQNVGSTVVSETKWQAQVPIYQGEPLSNVLGTELGLAYKRAFHNTNLSSDDIAKGLMRVSRMDIEKIVEWTPNQESRANRQERAAVFNFDDGRFHVNGFDWHDVNDGRSRGVSVESKSAKPTRENQP